MKDLFFRNQGFTATVNYPIARYRSRSTCFVTDDSLYCPRTGVVLYSSLSARRGLFACCDWPDVQSGEEVRWPGGCFSFYFRFRGGEEAAVSWKRDLPGAKFTATSGQESQLSARRPLTDRVPIISRKTPGALAVFVGRDVVSKCPRIPLHSHLYLARGESYVKHETGLNRVSMRAIIPRPVEPPPRAERRLISNGCLTKLTENCVQSRRIMFIVGEFVCISWSLPVFKNPCSAVDRSIWLFVPSYSWKVCMELF